MATTGTTTKITHAEVRMYCMGTGDCFIIKFLSGKKVKFKMMIDCGTWQGSKEHLTPYIESLKEYVNNSIDLLVVTHEHKDHVHVFQACKDLFTKDFEVKKIWLAWTEQDGKSKVDSWKTKYGDKKKALALATDMIENYVSRMDAEPSIVNNFNGDKLIASKKNFAAVLRGFTDLHFDGMAASGTYVGALEGMRIVKKEIAKDDNIEYLFPGDIIEDVEGAKDVKFYILGPPETFEEVKTEGGGKGESYTHNSELEGMDAFAAAVNTIDPSTSDLLPFDTGFLSKDNMNTKASYDAPENDWRTIEYEWLNSAASLALRMNSLTNNLSLAIAIEFEKNKRVMLFPGDAEYGSWKSWHDIHWAELGTDGKHLTEDLLNRTIFYKVAHHMSHNGTAQRLGLEMMTHKDLVAMATLDYNVISSGWTSTMPNRELIDGLLTRTKGRLMIMNEEGLFYDFHDEVPLTQKIGEARKKMNASEKRYFNSRFVADPDKLYIQYTVKV